MGETRVGLLEFGDLSLRDVIATAKLADDLGFSRIWLTEHVGTKCIENSLLLTPIVAGSTARIRVGPAGVLLRYYAAAAVARDGMFLESTFERIDLGLAGGSIAPPEDAPFIDGRVDVYSAEAFERKLRTVAELISRSDRVSRPELWFLGSSDSRHRGESAARLQAHFALSLILTPTPPSALPICAYRETEARLGLEPGNAVIAFPLACLESPRDRANYRSPHSGVRGATFVDTAARCRERIEELCHLYNVNEVCILESSAGIERRGASLRMLAEAFGGLAGPPAKGRVPSPGELD
ncbi:MAG: LLM class flavin-dependent oxidoreductase [Polyangiaceae bacterium]